MAQLIREDDIERRSVQLIKDELHYDKHLNCFADKDDGNAQFGRDTTAEVVNKTWLRQSLKKLNPSVSAAVLAQAEAELTKNRRALSDVAANREIHTLLTKGIDINTNTASGAPQQVRVRFIDFDTAANNHFAVVQQLWIQGKNGKRRPDLLIYVNGLPLIFIELKNASEQTRQAFEKNVKDYRRDIPHLFHYNLLLILSNGIDTKVGSMTSEWEHFFNWEKVNSETDHVVPEGEADYPTVLRGLCGKETLIDMLQHYVLYFKERFKIVAKNHQYLGVNNAVRAFGERATRDGKLGVFWHTQGSGKSFSMVYFVQKVQAVYGKRFKFVVITDRDELEKQIIEQFEQTGIIPQQKPDKKDRNAAKDKGVKATSRDDLHERLKNNDRYVFTLIQKFSTKGKGVKFPVLNESQDIILIVDEAHRSQYNDLAQNMRRALPNAQKIAFTGTPLIGVEKEKTVEWFGGYVSRYDFSDSVADGSTVRLIHQNRVPQMQLINDQLNADIEKIFYDEKLSEEDQERLLREQATIETVIGDADRLREIAKDIVKHFVNRGYLGKGMVISISKEVAVRMYDFVQQYWRDYKQDLLRQRNGLSSDSPKRGQIDATLRYMTDTKMAVVISYTADDEAAFDKKGLNLSPHIKEMERIGAGYETIEDRFKNPDDPFRLVFVCSKWLTGFDAPTISTLYLDKPMQNHTLMQTIARANRVAPALNSLGLKAIEGELDRTEKKHGLIIDYIDVFRAMEKALSKYGKSKEGGGKEYPVEQFEALIGYLDAAITEAVKFLAAEGLNLFDIINQTDTFDKIDLFKAFAEVLVKTDDLKKGYSVHQVAVSAFYEACKPDITEEDTLTIGAYIGKYERIKGAFEYLRKIMVGKINKDGNYDEAKQRSELLIDESIVSKGYTIKPTEEIDLSGIDLEKLQAKFERAPYPRLAIEDMLVFLQTRLAQLLARNVTRIDLAQRLQAIIDGYNEKGSDVQAFFKALKEYAAKLRTEEVRAAAEGLTEAELEVFDLLFEDKLTAAEKQKVKLAAQALLQKLKDNDTKRKIMVTDWHRNVQTQGKVKDMIGLVLYDNLPQDIYNDTLFKNKWEAVYGHIYKTASLGQQYWA
jgi:type I restriction enzyme, R subunit